MEQSIATILVAARLVIMQAYRYTVHAQPVIACLGAVNVAP